MTVVAGANTAQQWRLAMIAETTVGTANTTTMQLFNILGPPSWDRNTIRLTPVRSSTGRTAKTSDVYYQQKYQEKTCTFSALVGATELQMLLENCIGNTVGSDPAGWAVETGYTNGENGAMKIGDSYTDNTGTMTMAIINPIANKTEVVPACVVRSLVIKNSLVSDDTLTVVDVTVKSWSDISTAQSIPASMVAYTAGSSVYNIFDICGANYVAQLDGNDVVVSGFELTLDNGVKAYGYENGDPQTIERGIENGEFVASAVINVKHDSNTVDLMVKSIAMANAVEVIISDNSWASATFGIKGDHGYITDNIEPSEVEGAMFLPVNLKFLDNGTADLIEVVA